MNEKEWNEVNTLLAYLRDFKAAALIDRYHRPFGNSTPAEVLTKQIEKVQELLNSRR